MSVNRNRKNNRTRRQERQFRVRGIRRDPVDIGKLSRAVLGLAQAEAERQAQAEHTTCTQQATNQSEVTPDEQAPPGGGSHD